MSAPDRRAMLDRADGAPSVRRLCALLGLARSGVYRALKPANDNDGALTRRIDELFTAWPFLGSRRMTAMLRTEGVNVNRKRVRRLMRLMGVAALGPKPRTSKPAPGHKIYPYLLRDVTIERANHVWAADITYIPIGRGFLYLVAIIDWASRAVLGWRLSNTMDVSFCLAALEEARSKFGKPEIFNTGLAVHLGRLHRRARRSGRRDLHGRPRTLDGQRLHRAAVAVAEVRGCLSQGLRRWPGSRARHRRVDRLLQRAASAPGAGRPNADGGLARGYRRRRGCGHDGQRIRVAHMPTATEADAASRCVIERNPERPRLQLTNRIKRSRCAGPFQMMIV